MGLIAACEVGGRSGSAQAIHRVPGGSTAQLIAAARSARAGDVISLSPGIYSGVELRDLRFAGPVTITSADPANPAVLFDLTVRGSRNLAFSQLVLNAQDGGDINDFTVRDSSDIAFDHVEVKGPPLRPDLLEAGLMFRVNRAISVTNSEFHNLRHGVSLLDNDGVTVSRNTFHDLRTDGIRGGGNSNVVVADNLLADFHPAPGDHPDAIQFWTGNTTASAKNITVTGNVFVRGRGSIAQGIFFRDQVGNLPYQNVTIDGNLIVGAMGNGIASGGIGSGRITNNTVVALQDFPKSWILVALPADMVIEGNVATLYIVGRDMKTVPAGNRRQPPVSDGGAALLSSWLAKHAMPGGDRPIASQLLGSLGFRASAVSICAADEEAAVCIFRHAERG